MLTNVCWLAQNSSVMPQLLKDTSWEMNQNTFQAFKSIWTTHESLETGLELQLTIILIISYSAAINYLIFSIIQLIIDYSTNRFVYNMSGISEKCPWSFFVVFCSVYNHIKQSSVLYGCKLSWTWRIISNLFLKIVKIIYQLNIFAQLINSVFPRVLVFIPIFVLFFIYLLLNNNFGL